MGVVDRTKMGQLVPSLLSSLTCSRRLMLGLREDWLLASVVNHTIVTDPTIQQPGFDLPCHTWSLMNRFWTGQGACHANLHKWGLAQLPSRDCGHRQTMNHTVNMCPLIKFEGGPNLLYKVDDDTVIWLESTATAALAKLIIMLG